MKLRNKKTGEIVTFETDIYADTEDRTYEFKSIAELNKEWEDYEEPKELGYWYYDTTANRPEFIESRHVTKEDKKLDKQIGNYFETKEEAEKAVEKLKAWKRLKDAGVTFKPKVIDRKWYLEAKAEPKERTFSESHDLFKDVMLIFGGEE